MRLRPIAGGSICEAFQGERDGERVFVKRLRDAPHGLFATEAAGLRWLGEAPHGPRVPHVLEVGEEHIVLEWIEPAPVHEKAMGRALAHMHAAGAPQHGAAGTLYLGSVVLEEEPAEDWATVYADRLRDLAARAGLSRSVEPVCERMEELAGPAEPPARLHGDLWSGNVMGPAAVVDPAAHGGHRELDLAMLRLFGNPPQRLFDAYEEVQPLAPGHEERVPLWQLQPLLVHAILFGGGYGAEVERTAKRLAPYR